MKYTAKRFTYFIMFSLLPIFGFSQLNVDNTLNAEQAVDVLLGEGVTAFNITYSGGNEQVGSFDCVDCNIGIGEGFILASGDVAVAVGPNDSGSSTLGGGNFGASDPDLEIANPDFTINDAATIEFDFIASGDSIQFNYVWASEEYPEYVNSSFNDVFGFFLSGAGINGPYTNNAENIALIPGTSSAVTIDNVNNGNDGLGGPCVNCEYYIHNPTGTDDTSVQFDGFTTLLTAAAQVQCGETYHIKITLADAGDTAFDSAVFIEAGSFTSNGVLLESEASLNDSPVFFGDSVIVEGCNDAVFTLFRPNATSLDTIYYNVSGSADIDDYSGLPDFVVMDTGVHEVDILISAILDGLDEDTESIIMSYTYVDACGDTAISVASLWIMDYIFPEIFIPEEITGCPGEDVTLTAEIVQGFDPFTWLWDTGGMSNTITVAPEETTTYSVLYTDVCGQSDSTEVTVNIGDIPPVELDTDDVSVICAGDQTTISVDVLDGVPGYTYDWSTGGNTESTNVSPNTTTTYEVTVTDNCGQTETAELTVTVPIYDPIEIDAESTESICPGFELQLSASAEGGLAPYTYEWAGIGEGATVNASPFNETTYTVTVTDECGVEQTGTVTAIPGTPPPLNYDPEINLCFGVGSGPIFSEGVPFTDGPSYSYVYDLGVNEINGTFSAGVGVYEITAEDACGTTGTVELSVEVCEIEVFNVFTPGVSGGLNDIFEVKGANGFPGSSLKIYNRWGTLIYDFINTSSQPKLSWDGEEYPEGTYYYTIDIKGQDIQMIINGKEMISKTGIVSGTFTLLR